MAKKTTEKEHLGKMVRCARTSRGFRQKELGELVGLSRSQVSALEGGTDQAQCGRSTWSVACAKPSTYIRRPLRMYPITWRASCAAVSPPT